MTKQELRESIRRIIAQELNENLTIKGKKVKTYKQNGDKSYAVVYDDGTKVTIMVSDKEWDTLNDAPKLAENSPAPSKPKETPGPAVAPGKPGQKPGPRRPLGNPDVKPAPKAKAKATMEEASMLAQIVKRFKSKRKANEGIDDISMGVEPYSRFKSADELINSISGRLITASQMQDWNLVDEIATDVFNFTKNK